MKELSIEDKAKLYDEALIRGSRLWESNMITRENYEYIFPEVKESDDERIRKWCISHFKECINVIKDNDEYKEYLSNKVIAYLEKQGEHANFRNKIQIGDKVTRNEDGVLVNLSQLNRVAKKQGEQKSIDDLTRQDAMDIAVAKCFEWDEQEPAAWSEEDETMLKRVIDFIPQCMTAYGYNEYINWLKTLKDRVQPHNTWKPSDEQMEGIECTIKTLKYQLNCGDNRLDSLYNDLKKLRDK